MDKAKLDFLEEVLGVDGAKALVKASERAEKLKNVIVPRAILSWVNAAAQMSYTGAIPGIKGCLEFAKSECSGEMAIGKDTYEFNAAGVFSVAAAMAVSLGADDDQFDTNLKDKDIVRLGKSIDLLVKSKMARSELAKAELRKSPITTPYNLASKLTELTGVDPKQFDLQETKPLANGMFHHIYALKDGQKYKPYWKEDGFSYGSPAADSGYARVEFQNHVVNDYQQKPGIYFRHSISPDAAPFGNSVAEVEGMATGEGLSVLGSKVKPDQQYRGRGLGKLAYAAAALHHNSISSGDSVSDNATKAYQAMSQNPALKVSLGAAGDRFSHHSIGVADPAALHAQLYGSQVQKAEGIKEPEFRPVPSEEFESALSKLPDKSSIDTTRDYTDKRTFLSNDGLSGYALKADGELNHVFSLRPGMGAFAVKHAIQNGAKHLTCFDGFLPKYYSQFGFKEHVREQNWTPGGPDVVHMKLEVQKAEGDAAGKGRTAEPRLAAPQGPVAPGKQQGQAKKPTISMGTPAIPGQQAEVDPFNQKNRVAQAAPATKVRVSKSESQRKCDICQRTQFNDGKFTGCWCTSDLAKSVKTIAGPMGYTIEFAKGTDPEIIVTVLEAVKE